MQKSPNVEQQAERFSDLEGAVCDVRNMSNVLWTLAEDALTNADCKTWFGRPAADGYRVYVLTNDQAEGLWFAIAQMRSMAVDLSRAYYKPLDDEAPRKAA